jgi:hypothetical protein
MPAATLEGAMIRRTRGEISKYYEEDLSQQGLSLPDVADPEAAFLHLQRTRGTVPGDDDRLAVCAGDETGAACGRFSGVFAVTSDRR